jgi:D-glycero-alpha-D-manno-heptose 1-phosphate guanylyltransferase
MLILAGGLGTRLKLVVNQVPKPMAPVAGRPFLEYILDYWVNQGVKSFVLSIGFKAEIIKEYFGTSYRGAKVSYIEEQFPLGTGGAIKKALQEYRWAENQILLVNGDTWFEVDLNGLAIEAAKVNKPITVALKVCPSNDRYGAVICDDGSVQEFGAKIIGPCLINGGCYLLDINFLLKNMEKYSGKFSFEDDVLPELALSNKIAGSVQDGKFLDIGIPEDYRKAFDVIEFKTEELKRCYSVQKF